MAPGVDGINSILFGEKFNLITKIGSILPVSMEKKQRWAAALAFIAVGYISNWVPLPLRPLWGRFCLLLCRRPGASAAPDPRSAFYRQKRRYPSTSSSLKKSSAPPHPPETPRISWPPARYSAACTVIASPVPPAAAPESAYSQPPEGFSSPPACGAP